MQYSSMRFRFDAEGNREKTVWYKPIDSVLSISKGVDLSGNSIRSKVTSLLNYAMHSRPVTQSSTAHSLRDWDISHIGTSSAANYLDVTF